MADTTRQCDRRTRIRQYHQLEQSNGLIMPWDCLSPLRQSPVEARGSAPFTTMLLIQARSSGDHWHVEATGHGVNHHLYDVDGKTGLVRTLQLETVMERHGAGRGLDLLRQACSQMCLIVNETDEWESLGA